MTHWRNRTCLVAVLLLTPAVSAGQAIFASGGRASIEVGDSGLTPLVAYPSTAPIASLLQTLGEQSTSLVPQLATVVPELTGLTEARK